MEEYPRIVVANDASGAVQAAQEGLAVMIVDIIDMSTTLEGALDRGACAVLGASPDMTRAPVFVDPARIGRYAAELSHRFDSSIVLIAEPRVGKEEERLKRCTKFLKGVEEAQGRIAAVVPNLGAETAKLVDFKGKVVVAITDAGGVAFDAAFQVTDRVITGTVARTLDKKGKAPAEAAVVRALQAMRDKKGIAVVAASANSLEDVLAAEFLAKEIRKSI